MPLWCLISLSLVALYVAKVPASDSRFYVERRPWRRALLILMELSAVECLFDFLDSSMIEAGFFFIIVTSCCSSL